MQPKIPLHPGEDGNAQGLIGHQYSISAIALHPSATASRDRADNTSNASSKIPGIFGSPEIQVL